MQKSFELLSKVYTPIEAKYILSELGRILLKSKSHKPDRNRDNLAVLITYANTLTETGKTPLASLNKFIKKHKINQNLQIVHILPFYPWDTDRGFSVMDYYKVDPNNGTWKDIKNLSESVHLMFDFVANHASIDNPLVQKSLIERHLAKDSPMYKNYKEYKDFVISFGESDKPKDDDLKLLARPRPNPVLTPYYVLQTKNGFSAILGTPSKNTKYIGGGYVWTTFSRPLNKDGSEATRQVDLNFRNPKVFIETIRILKFYIEQGATHIRLDAIGYIWKKVGSTSLHEKEAHYILEAIHNIMAQYYPSVTTIAEINEQQDKVFEYLGTDKNPQSDMVYQFTHFPLSIYSLLVEDTSIYKKWYMSTKKFKGKQFITVLGSHDGLGLKPVRNILNDIQVSLLQKHLIDNMALPNYAQLPGGKQIVYEICATPWNLINSPNSKADLDTQIKKYLVVVAMGLTVKGLPAFYINGILGTGNYSPKEGLDENRTINRQVFKLNELEKELSRPENQKAKVLDSLSHMISIYKKNKAFSAVSPFPQVLDLKNNKVFALKLMANKESDSVFSLINVSGTVQTITPPLNLIDKKFNDLLTNTPYRVEKNISLSPYQVLWLN